MKRSRVSILIVGALVLGLAAGSVGLAYAADDEDTKPGDGIAEDLGRAMRGAGGGMLDILADLTGLEADELVEEARDSGKSMTLIAEENGVASDTLIDELYQQSKSMLDERLADGLITAEQYDFMLDEIAERAEARVLGDGPGFRHGPGMRGGPRGESAPGEGPMGGPGGCLTPPAADAAPDA